MPITDPQANALKALRAQRQAIINEILVAVVQGWAESPRNEQPVIDLITDPANEFNSRDWPGTTPPAIKPTALTFFKTSMHIPDSPPASPSPQLKRAVVRQAIQRLGAGDLINPGGDDGK